MWTWLGPPRVDDELVSQRARLLNRVLWAVLILILPFAVAGVLLGPRPGFAVAVYGVMAGLHLGLLTLLSRGYVAVVGRAYVVVYFLLMTGLLWFNGGVTPNHSAVYVTITLLAGLTVSPRAGLATAVVSTAATLAVALAQSRGLLPPALQPAGLVEDVTSNVANLVFAAVFVAISMRGLGEALSRARESQQRAQARAQQNAALAALAPGVVSEPSARAFALAVVQAVAKALGARWAVAVTHGPDGAQVLASHGDVQAFEAPAATAGLGVVPQPSGRLALAPVAGKAAPRGHLAVQLGPDEDGVAVLEFLSTAAAMLGGPAWPTTRTWRCCDRRRSSRWWAGWPGAWRTTSTTC